MPFKTRSVRKGNMMQYADRKLATVAASIAARAQYVEQAQRATSENIYTLERIVANALPLAARQFAERQYYPTIVTAQSNEVLL